MRCFDWDEYNIAHVERHDVTPQEIEEVFNDDPEFAYWFTQDGERRYQVGGVTVNGRYLTAGYTERDEMIRPITAWNMTSKEGKDYDAKKIDRQK